MPRHHPFLDGPYPRAFAHRGWCLDDLDGCENSAAAFDRALAGGFTYLETDVRATADGEVVVLHDPTLDRTTDASGAVDALPWATVRTARIAGREPLVRLAEVLGAFPDALWNIDVKADSAVEPVLAVLRHTDAWDRVCLASFSDRRLARLRAGGGDRLLTSAGPVAVARLRATSLLPARVRGPGRARDGRADGWARDGWAAQIPERRGPLRLVDAALLRAAHDQGREVHVWTVDAAADMHRLLDLGVDGLMTDRPDVLRAVLDARAR